MSALFLMFLVVAYLGSNLLLYDGHDDENPFFIIHFLGVALGASLASPKVPLWLTFLGAGLAIVAIILSRNFRLLLFLFQGLLIWAFMTLVVIDVRAHGHSIATATLSFLGITFSAILALRFRNVISWIGLVISAIMILLFAFGGEFFAAFALDVVLFVAMIFLM